MGNNDGENLSFIKKFKGEMKNKIVPYIDWASIITEKNDEFKNHVHNAKFTNFSRDLGGSVEGNPVGASFCLRCSYGNFGLKCVFWHKTRSCRTAGAGRGVSLQPPAVALRKIYKLKSRFRRPSRKEFVRCVFLSTVFLG